jgi:hypothetical protein
MSSVGSLISTIDDEGNTYEVYLDYDISDFAEPSVHQKSQTEVKKSEIE